MIRTGIDAASSPHCGFGFIYTNTVGTATARGAGLDWGVGAGVFGGPMWFGQSESDWSITFRCVYEP